MKIRAKNGEQTIDITLPATDMDMQYCMKCIGIEDIVPVCCISEVWDEPYYFGFLKGQTISMDELNFFARRLDGMTEYEKRVVGVYSSETGSETTDQPDLQPAGTVPAHRLDGRKPCWAETLSGPAPCNLRRRKKQNRF